MNSIGSVCELLKQPNIDVNTQEPFGCTPLYMASYEGRARVVCELLRNNKVGVNRMGDDGLAPLHVASRKGNIQVVCALLKSENSKFNIMPYDADLLSLIKSLLSELRQKFTPIWVKGHQDSFKAYENLPLAARLNIDADFLTTQYRQRGRLKSMERLPHEPCQQCTVTIN